jgi:hypothetical protein
MSNGKVKIQRLGSSLGVIVYILPKALIGKAWIDKKYSRLLLRRRVGKRIEEYGHRRNNPYQQCVFHSYYQSSYAFSLLGMIAHLYRIDCDEILQQ